MIILSATETTTSNALTNKDYTVANKLLSRENDFTSTNKQFCITDTSLAVCQLNFYFTKFYECELKGMYDKCLSRSVRYFEVYNTIIQDIVLC